MRTSNNYGIVMNSIYIRERKMRSGKTYIYLQYYPAIRNPRTKKRVEWESLKLEVYSEPKNKAERDHNNEVREMAELIKGKRMLQLANESYGFIDKKRAKQDAIKYFEDYSKFKQHKCGCAFLHFKRFMDGTCTFADITVELCNEFKDYLLYEAPSKTGGTLHQNSASAYFNLFRGMLKQAFREHWLTTNVNEYLDPIKCVKTNKPYLTLEEVKDLSKTYCEIPVLKRAALFSCLTGLRISDILTLKWENIVANPYGGFSIHKTLVKTGQEVENPISDEAFEYCGKPSFGLVFKGLERKMLYTVMPDWIKDAGIEKHITFHCFRHTYATLQIAAGTDIYTVSKMLNHANVQTTQIYADLVNEKKMETISKITLKDTAKKNRKRKTKK